MSSDSSTKPAKITANSRRYVGANAKFDICFHHVIDAAGHELLDYPVVEPKRCQRDRLTRVCVLPIVDGKVALNSDLLVFARPRWKAPKGVFDDN